MDGMGMMLKSLGFDPEQLKAAATQVQAVAQDFQARLDRIEKKLDWIGHHIDLTITDEETWTVFLTTLGGSNNGSRSSTQSGGVPK